MNDRFKFRLPFYDNQNNFIHFEYLEVGKGLEPYNAGIMHHNNEYEQCTGLKDKNGNLIYEGDLIKSPNNSHPLAVYHDTTGLWRCKENRLNGIWELPLYDIVRNYTVEIIGNIHEQAETRE